MRLFKSMRLALLMTPTALLLSNCLTDPLPEFGPKEYPISSGRYFLSSELDMGSRATARRYEDFGDSGVYRITLLSRPDCKIRLETGSWYVRTPEANPGKLLTKHVKKVDGATDLESPCLEGDAGLVNQGSLYHSYVRNITESSFEACPHSYEVCNQLCETAGTNPDGKCYNHVSTPADTALWKLFVK